MQRFVNRVAMVTGGGHGTGLATAHRLAREGAAVAVADIDTDAAGVVAREVGDAGGNAVVAVSCGE